MTQAAAPLSLADLVAPLSAEAFSAQHWTAGRPALSRQDLALVEKLKAIEGLASVEALVARHKQDVILFGPRAFRSMVPPQAALDFLDAGYNLYFTKVEETVVGAKALFLDVARELGVAPWQVHLEAFAGRAGGVSSRHYDHDINFQILLDGEKEWQLEENRHIQNPLAAFHPRPDRHGRPCGFREEVHALDRDMPQAFDPARSTRVRAEAGTVLFLPRGFWHETTSLRDTWGLNLVIKGVTWAGALGRALTDLLHRHPQFRAYCEGTSYGGHALCAQERARHQQVLEEMKQAAVAVLADLTLEDVALAPQGGQFYRWSARAEDREVRQHQSAWALCAPQAIAEPLDLPERFVPIMKQLCAFRHPFAWSHARGLLTGVSVIGLCNLLSRLVLLGLLEEGVEEQ